MIKEKKCRREFLKKSITLSSVFFSSGLILANDKLTKPIAGEQKELIRLLTKYGSEFGQVTISRKGI